MVPQFPDEPKWKAKDTLGVVLMAVILGGGFYLAYEKTHRHTIDQAVALSPRELKDPAALLKNNKPQEALGLLDAILKTQPDYVQARILRAHAYVLLNDEKRALSDATTLLKQNKPQYALSILDDILAKKPDQPNAHYLKAIAYSSVQEDRKAIVEIDKTLKARPELASAHLFKAQRLVKLSQFQNALVSANKAIELNPADTKAFITRSAVHEGLGDAAKSLDDSNEAVRLSPKNPDALSCRGYSYINLQLTQDAINDFSQALKLDPNLIGAMNGRMFAYFMHADYIECDRQCMDILAKVGLQDPSAPHAVIMSAICRKQLKEEQLRNAMLIQAVQRLPAANWPYPIVQYLAGQATADAVFQQATDKDKMTEAKTYIAFDLLAENRGAEASPMLLWVKEHGNKTFNEYDLVSALLAKVGR